MTTATGLTSEIRQVLQDAVPIIVKIALELDINVAFGQDGLGSVLSARKPLVTTYDFNEQFVSARPVNDDFTASWMSTGNTTNLRTLLLQLSDHKDMITICITRKFKLFFPLCLLTPFSLDLECVFPNPFPTARMV